MKTPVDIVRGRIVGYDERAGEIIIRAPYTDYFTLAKRQYAECSIQLLDGRQLSRQQRNLCYKLIREISEFSGMGLDPTKKLMKEKFIEDVEFEGVEQDFSLSNAGMSLVCAFQRYLVRFILDWNIPTTFPLLNFVDDVPDYLYGCLVNRRCCICGKPSDLHHCDHVGAGRDRADIVHEGMEVLPLCREHHTEVHAVGQKTFNRKHHIEKGIRLDRALCDLYGLRTNEEELSNDVEPYHDSGKIDPRP